MVSPCRECGHGMSDKNNDDCQRCERRIAYVAALEGRSCSMPVEMTDMTRRSNEKTAHDDQFLRDNPDMPVPEIAKVMGRSVASIYVRRSKLGIHRSKVSAVETPIESKPIEPLKVILPALFKGREALYDQLKQLAARELRTPENQVIYLVQQACKGGAVDH